MKKVLFSIAIMAIAAIGMVSCGNNGKSEPSFATDSVKCDSYKWFTWTAQVPQGKGYAISETKPEALKDFGSGMVLLAGDKVVVCLDDFEDKSLEEWKTLVNKPDYTGTLKKDEMKETEIAGRKALSFPIKVGGSKLELYGYNYFLDCTDFAQSGYENYKSIQSSVLPADGQPEKIDQVLQDEEVKYILDNMKFTAKK